MQKVHVGRRRQPAASSQQNPAAESEQKGNAAQSLKVL
jgi:hypothetical protein